MARWFLIAFIYLFGVVIAFAAPNPPSPGFKAPPPPPGLPINEHIFMVLITALLFGLFVIFRHQIKLTSNSKSPF